MRSSLRVALALLVSLACAPGAHGAIPIVDPDVDGGDVSFTFGGYVRAYAAWQKSDVDGAPEALGLADTTGLSATVFRTEWKLGIADIFALELHNRFYQLISSQPLATGLGAGAGVSAPPTRSLDLRSVLVDDERYLLEHDLDRLAIRLFLDDVDFAIGRQAITWGTAFLFPVADVWSSFSPFDLDNSQKRGIDAIRASFGVTDDIEMDVIVADRGSVDDLSGGLRTTFYLDAADVYVAAAKSYEKLLLATGVSAEVDVYKLRGELVGLYDLDDAEVLLPRATLGFDWFVNGDFMWGVEAHFNGLGAAGSSDYVAQAAAEETARGESYLLGRWYAGVYGTYKPHDLVTLSLTSITNLGDPSSMLAWSMTYQVAADVDLGLGGFHGLGEGVDWTAFPDLKLSDELGAYGHQVYLQAAAFF